MSTFTALRRSLADLLDPSRLTELLAARAERDEAVELAVQAEQEAERTSARMLQLRIQHSAAMSVVLAERDQAVADLSSFMERRFEESPSDEEGR